MRAVLKKLSNARVPVLPVLGLLLLWSALWAAVALAESLQEKQYEVAQAAAADCDTVAGGCHYLVLGGLTSGNVVTRLTTNASGELQVGFVAGSGVMADDGAFTQGTTLVMPAGFIYDETSSNDPEENDVAAGRIDSKRSQTFVMESAATRGLYAEVLTAGADDTANTTNGFWVYTALSAFDGSAWDRITQHAGNSDTITLGGSGFLDVYSVLTAFNGVTQDRLDAVDTGALVTEVCDSGSGSTLCADVQTAGADIANTENQLTTAAMLYSFDGTVYERVLSSGSTGAINVGLYGGGGGGAFAQVAQSNADDVATGANALDVLAGVLLFDEDDGNLDRVYGYDTDGDNVATEVEGVTLATTNFPMVYDLTGANFDRMSTGMVTGSGIPGTATSLNADGTSSCMTALSVGYYRITPVAGAQARAHCCRSGTTCTAATTDTPYLDGQYYMEAVADAAANDVICCITPSAGTDQIQIFATPLTF